MTLKDRVLDGLEALDEEPDEEERQAQHEGDRKEDEDLVAQDFPLQEVPQRCFRLAHLLRKSARNQSFFKFGSLVANLKSLAVEAQVDRYLTTDRKDLRAKNSTKRQAIQILFGEPQIKYA